MKRKIVVLSGDPIAAEIERLITAEGTFETVSAEDCIENACAETVMQKADAILFAGNTEDALLARKVFASFGCSPALFVLAENESELSRLNGLADKLCVPLGKKRTDASVSARFVITNLKIRAASLIESERKALHSYVTNLLINGCMNTSYTGFGLLRDAIVYCVENRCCSASLGKEVYNELAKRNRLTQTSVERNIRTAIERCWENSPECFCAGFLGSPCTSMRQKPTPKEFIATVAERVSLEIR